LLRASVHACHLYYIVVYIIIIILWCTSSSDKCVYTRARGVWGLSAGALELRSCSLRHAYIGTHKCGDRIPKISVVIYGGPPRRSGLRTRTAFLLSGPESEKSTHRRVRSGLGAQGGRWRRVCTHVIVFYAIRMWPSVYCLYMSCGSSEGNFFTYTHYSMYMCVYTLYRPAARTEVVGIKRVERMLPGTTPTVRYWFMRFIYDAELICLGI